MPSVGDNLSIGKLGRSTGHTSDYTSQISMSQAAGGESQTAASDFYISAVDNSLSGYPYVDEQTNETYEMTFTGGGSLFDTKIRTRYQNFTWTTDNSSLFAIQSDQDYTAQYNAQAISDATSYVSKSFESNLVTDNDFNAWADANTLNDWYESGGSVITRTSITTAPSSSNAYAVRFDTQDGYVSQSFTVKGNSTYEIVAHASASGEGAIDMYVSGAYFQRTWRGIQKEGEWHKTRDDFNTSGSNANQNLMIKFTAVSASSGNKPILDSIFFRRWEGSNFTDTNVEISGKFHEDGQSDGFNDHATRYNTSVTKTVEIQDTYGGLAIACFLPGTLILMSDKTTKPIEEINVGDEVMSLDLPGLPDEDLGYLKWKSFTMRPMDVEDLEGLVERNKKTVFVENLFYDYMDGYYSINNGYLKVTAEHDLFSYSDGRWRWITARELQKNMKLLNFLGEIVNIDTIEFIRGEVEVINFDVEPLDVYFAGGVLVHNKGSDTDPG